MEREQSDKFSWSGLFIVTACCSFLFNLALKFVDGSSSKILLAISILSAVLFVLGLIVRVIDHQFAKKKKHKKHFASE